VPFGSSRYPSSGAVSSPVSAPLVVVPALALVDTPRTLHAHALYILAAAPEPAASAASRPLALASWRLRFARALPAAFLSPNARSERAASRAAVPETPLPGARAAARAAICRATGLHASTHTAPRLVNAEPRGRRARASVEPPLVPIACARALRVPRRCLGGSRRCLRFVRLCATNHLCKLQRKLVSNRKSKEWSMLGSGKHFAIGKKEARRVWYLRVDCACCPQEAVAPR
jgi:hypothetical protein